MVDEEKETTGRKTKEAQHKETRPAARKSKPPESAPTAQKPKKRKSPGPSQVAGKRKETGRSGKKEGVSPARPKGAPAAVKSAVAPEAGGPDRAPEPRSDSKVIELPPTLTVRELAALMNVSPIDVIKELMNNGIMANINQLIDYDTAAIVGGEMGFEVKPESPLPTEAPEEAPAVPLRRRLIEDEDPSKLRPRPPVVTVLGHVDHGKTTLLDAIRNAHVVEGEAGGITQHIGAYQVELGGQKITFLDTPGHEAFTAMRARGAEVTDVAVLVVAAEDGVMPQTREAISHARAAQVPIVVAMNKVDKPTANPEMVKQQLADLGLVVEDWGGDVICVPLSAKQRMGIEDLLENILLVTEVAELKANPDRPGVGSVIEGKMDERRGPTATLLVQNGTLRIGDNLVVGEAFGRVRAMFDDKGKPVSEAGPSTPVAVLGLPEVPTAGDIFEVAADERSAREIVNRRIGERRAAHTPGVARPHSLEEAYSLIRAGQSKELMLILKADVQGSIEPIANSLEKLGEEELKVNLLHNGTGNISESDINLAIASGAIIIGFNVQADAAAQRLAEIEGVDIRLYDIIYKLVDDVDKALKGLLEPTFREVVIGHAEVRAVFSIPKKGNIAGSYVLDGQVTRNALARIRRNDEEIYNGQVASLKRFTNDVKEVRADFECGIGLQGFGDFQEGDIIEFYGKEQQEQQ
jgi:translation initiation factor IF-2